MRLLGGVGQAVQSGCEVHRAESDDIRNRKVVARKKLILLEMMVQELEVSMDDGSILLCHFRQLLFDDAFSQW